jgi:hypothetical protein
MPCLPGLPPPALLQEEKLDGFFRGNSIGEL